MDSPGAAVGGDGQRQDAQDMLLPPPPPPPFDEAPAAAAEPSHAQQGEPDPAPAPTGGLDLARDFAKVKVEGEAPVEPFNYKPVKAPLDAHLPQARLRLFCFDRTSGLPLSGVTVLVNTLDNFKTGKKANYARAFGNSSSSNRDGVVVLKLMTGSPYVVTATVDGYHKFGSMGEHLVVTMVEGETLERSLGMVPLRITVMVTLRELRPLAGKTQKHDPFGQVNPLYQPPPVDPMAIATPQKVAFYSPEGVRMSFVAMPLMSQDCLRVDEQECVLHVGDYSTDSDGHCFFYGARIDTWQQNYRRPHSYIDNGPWEYANKYHLRANVESSPVKPRFEHFVEDVAYPAHVAAHRPPIKAINNVSPPKVRARQSVSQAGGDETVQQMIQTPRQSRAGLQASEGGDPLLGMSQGGANRRRSLRNARPASPSLLRHTPSFGGGDDGMGAGAGEVAPDLADMIRTPPGYESSEAMLATGGAALLSSRPIRPLEPVDPNGIHNHLLPGLYNLSLADPSRLLIFYTYSPDNEQAEINKAQDSIVPFKMPELDASFYKPSLNGRAKVATNMRFPIQLYCRARPWFQIVVYDTVTLAEVGVQMRCPFTIYRLRGNATFAARLERVKKAMLGAAAGTETDPYDTPEGQADPQMAAYIRGQQQRGRLPGLWAKAEASQLQRTSSLQGRGWGGDGDSDAMLEEDMEDEQLYELAYNGSLDGDMERKYWITPGEHYAVEVHCEDPCMELSQRQVRQCSWQLEPFVFYTTLKVTLMVGVREKYNQAPIPGMNVRVHVNKLPDLQRPPLVKQDWCEGPEAYARRVLDQLTDWVVQSRRPETTGRVPRELHAVTGDDGIASVRVVPGSHLTIELDCGGAFETENSTIELVMGNESRQFQGFQLERICYVRVNCLDHEGGAGVEGFTIKAYDVTDRVCGLPGPTTGLSPKQQARAQDEQEDMLAEMVSAVDIIDLKSFHTSVTGPDGTAVVPIQARAGRVLKIVVAGAPEEYLLPHYLKAGSNSRMVYTYYASTDLTFMCPRKPRVTVHVADACTLEPVLGMRFRVFGRRLTPPYVPEGEEQAEALALAEARAQALQEKARAKVAELQSAPQPPPLRAFDEPHLDAGSIDAARPRSDDGDDDPGPITTLTGEHQVYWDGLPVPAPAGSKPPGDDATPLNARVLELISGMEAPPPGARGPMRRRLQDIGSWAERDSAQAAAARAVEAAVATGRTTSRLLAGTEGETGEELGVTGSTSRVLGARGQGLAYEPSEAATEGQMMRKLVAASAAAAAAAADAHEAFGTYELEADGDERRAHVPSIEEVEGSYEDVWAAEAAGRHARTAWVEGAAEGRDLLATAGSGGFGAHGEELEIQGEDGASPRAVAAAAEAALQAHGQEQGQGQGQGHKRAASPEWEGFGASKGRHHAVKRLSTSSMRSRASAADPEAWDYVTPKDSSRRLHAGGLELVTELEGPHDDKEAFEDREMLWYDTYTGYPGTASLMVDVGVEVRVQLLPTWPYVAQPQQQLRLTDSWHSPPPFIYFAARDTAAAAFWLDRDRAMPAMWEDDGCSRVRLPPHALLRLQPSGMPGQLAPCPLGPWVRRLLPPAVKAVGTSEGGHGGEGSQWGEAPDGKSSRAVTGAVTGAADAGSEDEESVRDLSAVQFNEDASALDEVRAAAWEHAKLGDVRFLPVDRTRLMQILVKWGAFPHIEGGTCKGCFWPQPSPSHPFLMNPGSKVRFASGTSGGPDAGPSGRGQGEERERWAQSRSAASAGSSPVKVAWGPGDPGVGGSGSPAPGTGATGIWKSSLFREGAVSLAAEWVMETKAWANQTKTQTPTHLLPHVPDKFARTHAIVAQSEAVYCTEPFFKWRLPDGSAVHVGMHDNLYRDLIPLLDSVAASVEFMREHLERVRRFNESRVRQGRFLLGHQLVDSALGGVFVMDASAAMPHGGCEFMLEQLASCLDFWFTLKPDDPPQYNVLLVAGDSVQVMHEALVPVTASNEAELLSWFQRAVLELGEEVVNAGFKASQVLSQAVAISDTNLPVVVIAGGLLPQLTEPAAQVNAALYWGQVGCQPRQRPLQPIFTVEVFPMPDITASNPAAQGASRGMGGAGGSGAASGGAGGYGGAEGEGTEALYDEDLSHLGTDIFQRLQDALAAGRMRLIEVFKETDKDGDGALSPDELFRLVRRLVPGATRGQMRYLQLLLDADGDRFISYKELATVVKAAARSGMSLTLGEAPELSIILVRVAFVMLLQQRLVDEIFSQYDHNRDGYWDQVEQWRALKDLFPSLSVDEQQQMFGALQAVDTNQDERISREEFVRAISRGGAAQVSGWRSEGDSRLSLTDEQEEERRLAQAARTEADFRRLEATRQAGFPLTSMLRKVAHTTRASHRRIDMGRARMNVVEVNLTPLEQLSAYLERSLAGLQAFEQAYGAQLTKSREAFAARSAAKGGDGQGQGQGSLAGRMTYRPARERGGDGGGSASARDEAPGRSRQRPKSAPLRRAASASVVSAPSRLLDSTVNRNAYVADLATKRGAAPSSLLNALAARAGPPRRQSASGSVASAGSGGSVLPDLPSRGGGTAAEAGRRTFVPPSEQQRRQQARPASAPVRPRPRPGTASASPLPALVPPPPPTARLRSALPMSSLQLEFTPPDLPAWTALSATLSRDAGGGGSGAASSAGGVVDPFVSKKRGPAGFASSILQAQHRSPAAQAAAAIARDTPQVSSAWH